MAQFLNFTRADGVITDGINLDLLVSWTSQVTEEGEPYVLLLHALAMPTLNQTTKPQPWSTRLTGSEREQFLRAIQQTPVLVKRIRSRSTRPLPSMPPMPPQPKRPLKATG